MIDFNWYTFSELTASQLYQALVLRSEIFVVEQQCAYLDPDGHDTEALHLLGIENNTLGAYLRLFPPKPNERELVFGRVVTAKSARNKGYGKKLIQELLNYCALCFPEILIKCSAQHYLKKFYEDLGFKTYGEVYDEDGILHIAMQKMAGVKK